MVYYNALLLFKTAGRTEEAGAMASRAAAFLEKLAGMVDLNALPESWRRELDELDEIVRSIV